MNPRSTGILVLIAAAVGAFVWFYEIEGASERASSEAAEKRFFQDLEPASVDWIELATSDGVSVRAERSDGRWHITTPLAFPGDASAWDAIASTLTTTTYDAAFEDPQPASVYGLAEGAVEVRFGAGDESHALRIGASAPIGDGSYAAVVGREAVYTVASWRANSLRKTLDDLRDKRVLDFDAGSVVAFEAEWPGARVALSRDRDVWRMTSPVAGAADSKAISDLLSDLAFLRAEGFADGPVAAAGLDAPAYRARLTLAAVVDEDAGDASGEAPAATSRVIEFVVGAGNGSGQRYARAAEASLYLIPEARFDALPRDVAKYRDRKLAEFAVPDAKRVELVFRDADGAPVTIVATRDGDAWQSEPEAMDPEKIASLVSELDGLTAETILAERVGPEELAGLDLSPPAAAFTVRAAEGDAPLAEVRLGALSGVAGVVAQSGENPQVFRLSAALTEQLPVSLVAFRTHFLAYEGSEETPELEVDDGLEFEMDPAALDALLQGQGQAPAPGP